TCRAIGGNQRAVAAADAPVEVGILIGLHIENGDGIELAAIDVGRDGIDHRVPAVAGLKKQAGGNIAAALLGLDRGLPGAIVECIQSADKIVTVILRERLAIGAVAPG